MKLTDIAKSLPILSEEYSLVKEALGTLSQLGVGPLINVAKQYHSASGRRNTRYASELTPDSNSFKSEIGPNSEIADGGSIKGIADLRKAYRNTPGNVVGFAVYLGGTPVAFGLADSDDLRKPSAESRIAYDLSAFKDQATAKKMAISSRSERKPPSWQDTTKLDIRTGQSISTGQLAGLLDSLQEIAVANNITMTIKLVLSDAKRQEINRQRYLDKRSIDSGYEDLLYRLKKYKLSKKPSVNSIEEFMEFVNSAKKVAGIVQFAGRSYTTTPKDDTYRTEENAYVNILNGKIFNIKYDAKDPGGWSQLTISYRYNPKTMMIQPIYATWSNPEDGYEKQTAVLNHEMYAQSQLPKADLNDKAQVIPELLTMVKAKKYKDVQGIINSLKQTSGADWPELDVINKSVAAELAKPKSESLVTERYDTSEQNREYFDSVQEWAQTAQDFGAEVIKARGVYVAHGWEGECGEFDPSTGTGWMVSKAAR